MVDKIKVIERVKTHNEVIYRIEEYFGISRIEFLNRDGWCFCGKTYVWDRTLVLFIESVLRGLNNGNN